MTFANIFDAEVVNDKTEEDGLTYVAPEAGCGGALIVTGCDEVDEECVCE